MFAPGYHYHLQRSTRPVARPPSKEALTRLENVEEKSEMAAKPTICDKDCTRVASGSVTAMSLYCMCGTLFGWKPHIEICYL